MKFLLEVKTTFASPAASNFASTSVKNSDCVYKFSFKVIVIIAPPFS